MRAVDARPNVVVGWDPGSAARREPRREDPPGPDPPPGRPPSPLDDAAASVDSGDGSADATSPGSTSPAGSAPSTDEPAVSPLDAPGADRPIPASPPRTSGGLGLGSPPPPMILRAAGTARTARCARRQPPVLRHDGSRPLEGGECRAAGLRSRHRPACPVRPPARRGQAVPPRARSDPPHPASTHPQGRSALLAVAAPANVACATPTTPRPATPAPLPGSGPACRCRKPRPRPPSRERPTETRSPAAPTSPRCPSR